MDVLATHQHDVANVEEIYPVESVGPPRAELTRKLRRLRYTQLIPLSLPVHVVVTFQALYFLDGLEAELQVLNDEGREGCLLLHKI